MSRQINQPINQVKLTNVAVVKMNKGGKRFEIACYRNKVIDYRQGLEQDLSEVLQTDRVFTNVSKGEFAKAKDLQKVFGTNDEEEIAKLILTKGQLQVSDKERTQQLEKTSAQIAEWISKNCVHPDSDRPYTISQIRHAMHQSNFSVHPTKPLKRQYLDCVKLLQNVIPIQRAKMELLLLVPSGNFQNEIERTLKENTVAFTAQQEQQLLQDSSTSIVKYPLLVDPSLYRVLSDVIQTFNDEREAAGQASKAWIEIVNQVVIKQGDVNLEAEVGNTLQSIITDPHHDDLHQTTRLLNQTRIDQDEDNDDDDDEEEEEEEEEQEEGKVAKGVKSDDDSDETERIMSTGRKAQKNAKKKKQKSNRRTEDIGQQTLNTQEQRQRQGRPQTAPDHDIIVNSDNSMSTPPSNNLTDADTSGRKSCNTCGGSFDTPADFRAHFKSDWHRFNQKLKMKGSAPISEKEFLLCDSDTFFSEKGEDIML